MHNICRRHLLSKRKFILEEVWFGNDWKGFMFFGKMKQLFKWLHCVDMFIKLVVTASDPYEPRLNPIRHLFRPTVKPLNLFSLLRTSIQSPSSGGGRVTKWFLSISHNGDFFASQVWRAKARCTIHQLPKFMQSAGEKDCGNS